MSTKRSKDPYGSSSSGGRWNPVGTRLIYAGSSPSVALLEYLCIKGEAVSKENWQMIVFDILYDNLIGEIDADRLPRDWNILPHSKSTQDFGKKWLEAKDEPFLKVPSSRIDLSFYPLEFNLLINPDFPRLNESLRVITVLPFSYLLN